MVDYNNWCDVQQVTVVTHSLKTMTARPADLNRGLNNIAGIVPGHYAAEERIAGLLRRLGKEKAAQFIEGKLPTSKSIRSGDLGEILATEYINTATDYSAPIKRLRWKDHRNMAMRGDDVIGLKQENTGRLRFLKAESKSRVALTTAVVTEARDALNKDKGLPSPHALAFIADRLRENGDTALSDAIDDEQLVFDIRPGAVRHLLFVFTQNDPTPFLQTSLETYAGSIVQECIGLRVNGHVKFVKDIFDTVKANAVNG